VPSSVVALLELSDHKVRKPQHFDQEYVLDIRSKFERLGTDAAPGQEGRQQAGGIEPLLRGDRIVGTPVDFSHGDVDAFTPTPGSFEVFLPAPELRPFPDARTCFEYPRHTPDQSAVVS